MAQLYQWTVPCIICESPVEYHCNTCGDVLCSKCRDNHLKSNAGRNHDVVPYSQCIEPKKHSLQCGDHPGHQRGVWCQTCNRAVCSECVTSPSHAGHRFLKFDAKIEEKRTEIRNRFEKYSTLLSQWKASLLQSEKIKDKYEKDVHQLDKEIVGRADELCEQVRAVERESRKRLQEMKESSLRALQDQQRSLTEGVQRLEGKTKGLEDILRSNNTSIILQNTPGEMKDTKPSFCSPPSLPVFKPGSSTIKTLKDIFGSLSEKNVPSLEFLSVQTSMLTSPLVESVINIEKDMYTPAIACVGSDQAWVRTGRKKLQLLDRRGSIQKTVNIDFILPGMSVAPQGNILLPDDDNRSIKTISMTGELTTLFSTKWKPWGICCLPSRDVVVAFREDRKVVQYSSTRKITREMDRSLFKCPWYVAYSQVNQQLYVCDKSNPYLNSAPGRVLALDITGSLQYTYTGPDTKPFTPVDVCTDQAGHVLITDIDNNRVHILDKGGNFLHFLLTVEQGLTRPFTIDVDGEGFAWIGEWNKGKMKVVKYMQI